MVTKKPSNETGAKLAALKVKREELELIVLQQQVNDMTSAANAAKLTSAQQERNTRQLQLAQKQKEDDCSHRKGGSNLDSFYSGGADIYAVVKHTYPVPYIPGFESCTGTVVHCQRCHKEWTRKDEDYQEALRFPTNNQPSGNALFSVTMHTGRAA